MHATVAWMGVGAPVGTRPPPPSPFLPKHRPPSARTSNAMLTLSELLDGMARDRALFAGDAVLAQRQGRAGHQNSDADAPYQRVRVVGIGCRLPPHLLYWSGGGGRR